MRERNTSLSPARGWNISSGFPHDFKCISLLLFLTYKYFIHFSPLCRHCISLFLTTLLPGLSLHGYLQTRTSSSDKMHIFVTYDFKVTVTHGYFDGIRPLSFSWFGSYLSTVAGCSIKPWGLYLTVFLIKTF